MTLPTICIILSILEIDITTVDPYVVTHLLFIFLFLCEFYSI